jgi:hypothetical protein
MLCLCSLQYRPQQHTTIPCQQHAPSLKTMPGRSGLGCSQFIQPETWVSSCVHLTPAERIMEEVLALQTQGRTMLHEGDASHHSLVVRAAHTIFVSPQSQSHCTCIWMEATSHFLSSTTCVRCAFQRGIHGAPAIATRCWSLRPVCCYARSLMMISVYTAHLALLHGTIQWSPDWRTVVNMYLFGVFFLASKHAWCLFPADTYRFCCLGIMVAWPHGDSLCKHLHFSMHTWRCSIFQIDGCIKKLSRG